jgi:hypothetical protein
MSKFKNWLESTKMLMGLRTKPILFPRKFFKVPKDYKPKYAPSWAEKFFDIPEDYKPKYAPEIDHLIPIADTQDLNLLNTNR